MQSISSIDERAFNSSPSGYHPRAWFRCDSLISSAETGIFQDRLTGRVLTLADEYLCVTVRHSGLTIDWLGYATTRIEASDGTVFYDDHPVRFTDEGLRLDHKPKNAIEWYVKIPHHEDYHLRMPAQPNSEQRDWLEALNASDAEIGESRLFQRDRTWYLHVTATRDGLFQGIH